MGPDQEFVCREMKIPISVYATKQQPACMTRELLDNLHNRFTTVWVILHRQ
jgi:hypothetical protein